MKTILVSHSDLIGGAAIAAYRTHQALRHVQVNSSMWVSNKLSDDWTVQGTTSTLQRLNLQLRATIGKRVPELLLRRQTRTFRSYNWLRSLWPKKLNRNDAELVHLMWFNAETLSIRDVTRIKKPLIMTLHDMWAFCGAEHYTEGNLYKEAYSSGSQGGLLSRFDADRWVWGRKRREWQQPFQLVAVSEWLAQCVRDSTLFADWPVCVIPNPIDTNVWKPLDQKTARLAFNLPVDKKIILFGAIGGSSLPRKGYGLLEQALSTIADVRDDIHLVIYGQGQPEHPPETGFQTSYVGILNDPVTMALLNNAADVFVSPATQEAFGQTASEAQACGLPVVAFSETGVADIVDHKVTGYLAQLSNSQELARGVLWVLDCDSDNSDISTHEIREKARQRAVQRFSYDVVGKQYKDLYTSILAAK